MWARVCIGLLVLAMVASGTTASHAHLHTGNGHRVAHDADHAGDPARPLWHAHGAPHAHDADTHDHESATPSPDGPEDDERPEDVVSIGCPVAVSANPVHGPGPVLVAIVVLKTTPDPPIRHWTAIAGALPAVHAPPLISQRSPRAPPTVARLHV